VPLTEACEMLTLDPPVLVSVTVCDCLAPTVRPPKFSLAGLSASWPEAAIPVPESGRFVAVFDASLVMVTVALKIPAALGVNLMLIVVLWSAATVTGRLGAVKEKYLLEIETLLMVTDAGPEFVAVTDRVLLLPAATLPKSRVADSRERVLCCWLEEPAALTPWHPTRKLRPVRRNSAPATFPRCFEQFALAAAFSIVSHGPVAQGSTLSAPWGRADLSLAPRAGWR